MIPATTAQTATQQPVHRRAADLRVHARREGTSSSTCASAAAIACVMSGNAVASTDAPRTVDELIACRLLIESQPDYRNRIYEVERLSPAWARIAACYPELMELMDLEAPRWRSEPCEMPRLQKLLTFIVRDGF